MLKKILACLDGSKFAERILPHAIERARHFNSKIVLFKVINVNISAHIISMPGMPGQPTPVILLKQLDSRIREEEIRARSYLDGVAAQLRGMGLDVDRVVLHKTAEGTIGSTIVAYAAANAVDLITIATHGHSGWKHLVFGSVAESVIKNSASPVLVVKPKDTETDGGAFSGIARGALA